MKGLKYVRKELNNWLINTYNIPLKKLEKSISDFADQNPLSFSKIPDNVYKINTDDKILKFKSDNLSITSTLITNKQLLSWINNLKIPNNINGVYNMVNDVNVNNPLYFDASDKKFRCKEDYFDHPVRGVTWHGALLFAYTYNGRLPTETEFEIIMTSGNTKKRYPWGDEAPVPTRANYGNIIGDTTCVKSYPPNDWGIYDAVGNLRVWCLDKYHPSKKHLFEFNKNKINSEYRIIKGGAWDKTTLHLNINIHEGKWWRIGTQGIGFRVLKIDQKFWR